MPLHWNNIKNIDAYIEWSGYDDSATTRIDSLPSAQRQMLLSAI